MAPLMMVQRHGATRPRSKLENTDSPWQRHRAAKQRQLAFEAGHVHEIIKRRQPAIEGVGQHWWSAPHSASPANIAMPSLARGVSGGQRRKHGQAARHVKRHGDQIPAWRTDGPDLPPANWFDCTPTIATRPRRRALDFSNDPMRLDAGVGLFQPSMTISVVSPRILRRQASSEPTPPPACSRNVELSHRIGSRHRRNAMA